MKASYNITDNKLRLDLELPRGERPAPELQARLKRAGYQFWPGSRLNVAVWSPLAEDLALELAGEVEEDDTPDDPEKRAERFAGYAESAATEAERAAEYATTRANTARRQELAERRAQREANRAAYWERRIKGVVNHALRKENPGVIARRVKSIEADKRRIEREKAEREKWLAMWLAKPITFDRAKLIANHEHYGLSRCFTVSEFPRRPGQSTYEGEQSIWSALDDEIITADQAQTLAIAHHRRRLEICARWLAHYEMRLAYENALLESVGGLAVQKARPEVGGGVKLRGEWREVKKVNRVTVSVKPRYGGMGFSTKWGLDEVTAIMTPQEWQAYNRGEFSPPQKG